MPTTREEREAGRALIRENLGRFVEEINSNRDDYAKTNVIASLEALEVISIVNLAETIEAQPGPPT